MTRASWHPWLVQFPLVLWAMSFVFDVASFRWGPPLVEAARYDLYAGFLAVIPAAATGIYDFLHLTRTAPANATVGTDPRHATRARLTRVLGVWHASLNAGAAGLLGASLVVHERTRGLFASTPPLALTFSAFALVLLGVSGYLGGVIAYNRRVTR